jgi:site-specific recombinase XerD
VRPVTCNTWLRALNAFFCWLHENGHVPTRVHLRPLKVEKRLVQTLDLDAIHAIVRFKLPTAVTVNRKHLDGPRKGQKAFAWWRIHALACALLDTGCRIQELLDVEQKLGLKRFGFHRLRHTFATEYLRRGGDVVRLSRTLGHTQITTTMRYLHLLTEDLSIEHVKVSILGQR